MIKVAFKNLKTCIVQSVDSGECEQVVADEQYLAEINRTHFETLLKLNCLLFSPVFGIEGQDRMIINIVSKLIGDITSTLQQRNVEKIFKCLKIENHNISSTIGDVLKHISDMVNSKSLLFKELRITKNMLDEYELEHCGPDDVRMSVYFDKIKSLLEIVKVKRETDCMIEAVENINLLTDSELEELMNCLIICNKMNRLRYVNSLLHVIITQLYLVFSSIKAIVRNNKPKAVNGSGSDALIMKLITHAFYNQIQSIIHDKSIDFIIDTMFRNKMPHRDTFICPIANIYNVARDKQQRLLNIINQSYKINHENVLYKNVTLGDALSLEDIYILDLIPYRLTTHVDNHIINYIADSFPNALKNGVSKNLCAEQCKYIYTIFNEKRVRGYLSQIAFPNERDVKKNVIDGHYVNNNEYSRSFRYENEELCLSEKVILTDLIIKLVPRNTRTEVEEMYVQVKKEM